jgi:opacity protein-like surface antigen
MTTLKLLSAALFAAAVIAAPAMAREHHVTRHSADETYADPAPYAAAPDGAYAADYGYRGYNYRCTPAPRVGAFAGDPWTNDVPCEPYAGAAY